MKPIFECRELSKSYNGRVSVLDHLSLTLESGQIVGLLGPNGSGKTTLIKLINDLLVPSHGEILIDGCTPGVETKANVSYLPDRFYLDKNLAVSDVLTYFADFYADFSMERAHQLLKDMEISEMQVIKTMSKGTLEKLHLALVMSRNAKFYVMDEPLGGVDPAARDYILKTVITNYQEDATILIATHLIADIENILDRVLFLQNGKLVLNQTVDEIRSQHNKSVDALFREVFKC